jgi:ABC-2 type transport system ATP-binding protein
MTSGFAIEANNVSKSYSGLKALNSVSFSVKPGELFGFIGPDGAGKTTLFRILVSLLLADSGSIRLAGLDVVKQYKEVRNILGYMPGRFSLYSDLSVEENLNFYATIFGTTIKENYHLIRDIYAHIEPYKKRIAGKLSGGMKQKLALSCALIHKPEILILDEPTTGVDAVSRKEFWEMLKKLQKEGITILVSTPYMDEATLCDRVALIQNGSILRIDTPQQIIDSFPLELWSLRSASVYALLRDTRNYGNTFSVFPFGQVLHYIDQSKPADTDKLGNYLRDLGHEGLRIESIKPSIEDCFMMMMGEPNAMEGRL